MMEEISMKQVKRSGRSLAWLANEIEMAIEYEREHIKKMGRCRDLDGDNPHWDTMIYNSCKRLMHVHALLEIQDKQLADFVVSVIKEVDGNIRTDNDPSIANEVG